MNTKLSDGAEALARVQQGSMVTESAERAHSSYSSKQGQGRAEHEPPTGSERASNSGLCSVKKCLIDTM